jgi:hypothetical protein
MLANDQEPWAGFFLDAIADGNTSMYCVLLGSFLLPRSMHCNGVIDRHKAMTLQTCPCLF